MRLFSPKITFVYEMVALLVLSVAAAHLLSDHHPKGLTWERQPLRPELAVESADQLPERQELGTIGTDMALRLYAEQDALFVDARFLEDYEAGHIPGAVNIAPGMFADEVEAVLGAPEDDTTLVIYCSSASCMMSHELGENLRMLGYTNILIYEAGFKGWQDVQGDVEQSE